MPYKGREEKRPERVVLAGDRRMRCEGNRDEKYGLAFILWKQARQLKEPAQTCSRHIQNSFNFVISFLNSSGDDAKKYTKKKIKNKKHPEFCQPEKSSVNVVMCFLPFVFLHTWLEQNRTDQRRWFTVLGSGAADVCNCIHTASPVHFFMNKH